MAQQVEVETLRDALKDAIRWLDAIESGVGNHTLVNLMPNNCLGRNDMRRVLEQTKPESSTEILNRQLRESIAAEDTKRLATLTPDEVIEAIAKKEFRVDTMELRHSDSLDFYDVSVWQIRDGLMAAYLAGQKSMTRIHRLATLTPDEDVAWENAFVCSKDAGMTDMEADAQAWSEVQREFPRLREFDGCQPETTPFKGHAFNSRGERVAVTVPEKEFGARDPRNDRPNTDGE